MYFLLNKYFLLYIANDRLVFWFYILQHDATKNKLSFPTYIIAFTKALDKFNKTLRCV